MELEAKIIEASKSTAGIQWLLDKAVDSLTRLDQLYTDGDVKKKRQIVGSIFPEKLVFHGSRYRTARLDEAVRLIYKLDKDFSQNKNGKTEENSGLSTLVEGSLKVSNILNDFHEILEYSIDQRSVFILYSDLIFPKFFRTVVLSVIASSRA